MLLYDSFLELDMLEFGIGIPMNASRTANILRALEERGAKLRARSLCEVAALIGAEWPVMGRADFERVHEHNYISRFYNDPPGSLEKILLATYELIGEDGSYNRYDPLKAVRPLSDLFAVLIHRVSGSYLAARVALARKGEIGGAAYDGFCFYLGGGTHHARYDCGSGFCALNDLIIAVRKLQHEGRAGLVWIVDVDAHKGDGSAELTQFSRARGETFCGKAPEIITLSVHMARGWPLDEQSLAQAEPGRAPLVESDIDIPIEVGEEGLYCLRLAEGLKKLEDLSGGRKPDLVLVEDGADVYEKDGLESTALIRLSLEQCLQRDRLILSFFKECAIPTAWLMAGGYGKDAWEPTAAFLSSL
ncbi:MAG: histone deacetylase [Treponema sp.]|jgi:acetoin utilization deacetylase AcuC-like enzyme|nr:histone deacetylase [Treponema sp.]